MSWQKWVLIAWLLFGAVANAIQAEKQGKASISVIGIVTFAILTILVVFA